MPGESLPGAAARRLREFTAGRHAARLALNLRVSIPRDHDRYPVWPKGWTGSISHCGPIALAAVMPISTGQTVGIDIEERGPLDPAVAKLVAEGTDGDTAKAVFVAKEAAYKAQFAVSRMVMGYDGFQISLDDEAFEAQFTQNTGPFRAGNTLRGKFWSNTRYLIATVTVSRTDRI